MPVNGRCLLTVGRIETWAPRRVLTVGCVETWPPRRVEHKNTSLTATTLKFSCLILSSHKKGILKSFPQSFQFSQNMYEKIVSDSCA